MRASVKVLLAILCGLLLLSVLAFAVVYVQGVRRPTGVSQYVAIGSSFASGPGLTPRSLDAPILCARSAGNYAHILAAHRKLMLVDVTCAGATTEHVLRGGQYFQHSQLDALTPETRLVTITIGGNDISYLGNLFALSCGTSPPRLASLLGMCTPAPDRKVHAALDQLTDSLREIAKQIHRRAPKARLVYVGYLSVLPAVGTCPRLGLTVADADQMRALADRLASATRDAAQSEHADLVDMATLSQGHDVCAAVPWLNDRHPPAFFTAPLHPNARGMEATAEAIDRLLGHDDSADETTTS